MSEARQMLSTKIQYMNQTMKKYNQVMEANKNLKQDLKNVQNELYSKTKPIRVTDDDYSTIITNLGKLFGKINNFPPNCKSVLKKDITIDTICSLFSNQQDQKQIKALNKLDYPFIAAIVEKYLIESLVYNIFEKGIHLDGNINQAYQSLYSLFESSGHSDWASDLRLKLARSTLEHLPKMQDTVQTEKSAVVDKMVLQLSAFYSSEDVIRPRIEKLVDMATDLCLPMHGQENPIEIYFLKSSIDKIIQKQVKRVYKPVSPEQDTIYLSISPVFLAKSTIEVDEDIDTETYKEGYTLVYHGKAIW